MGLAEDLSRFFSQNKIAFFTFDGVLDSGEVVDCSLEKASPARKQEFFAGRWCAAHVLRQLGYSHNEEIQRGANGEPLWPERITGSISHTKRFFCAAAAHKHNLAAIGVDAERVNRKISEGAFSIVANPAEKEALVDAGLDMPLFRMVLFSAKESFYKMLFPLVQRYFYFSAVFVTVRGDRTRGTFEVVLEEDLGGEHIKGRRYQGHYFADDQHLVTTCFM